MMVVIEISKLCSLQIFFNGTSSTTALMDVDINDEALTEESGLPNSSGEIAPEEQRVAYVSSKSTGDHASSTTQKKRSREDSNESSASTSGKKTEKTIDRDNSPTLQKNCLLIILLEMKKKSYKPNPPLNRTVTQIFSSTYIIKLLIVKTFLK